MKQLDEVPLLTLLYLLCLAAAVKVVGMLPQIQSSFYAASLVTSVSQKSGLFSVGRVPHYLIVDGMEKEVQYALHLILILNHFCYFLFVG